MDNEVQYERSYEALSQQEKNEDKENDDKDLVDFFQVKYLESQEVESHYQPSNLDESMQQNAGDAPTNNDLADQSLEHRRQFIDREFGEMQAHRSPEEVLKEAPYSQFPLPNVSLRGARNEGATRLQTAREPRRPVLQQTIVDNRSYLTKRTSEPVAPA